MNFKVKKKEYGLLIGAVILFITSLLFLVLNLIDTSNLVFLPVSITLSLLSSGSLLIIDYKKNLLNIIFVFTFFTFLVSGALFESLVGNDFFNEFSLEIRLKTLIAYAVASYTLFLMHFFNYIVCKKKLYSNKDTELVKKNYNNVKNIKFRKITKIAFYVTIACYYLIVLEKIFYRKDYNLTDYYANFNSSLPSVIVRLSNYYLIAFCLFLGTMPKLKECKAEVFLFLGVSVLTLLYGVRNIFVLNIILVIIYFLIRNNKNEKWISKIKLKIYLIVLPILIIFLQAFDAIRRSTNFDFKTIVDAFSLKLLSDFFINQSISSIILSNSIRYKYILGGQPVYYTFGSLYEYITQNSIVRWFTGNPYYTANSIFAALETSNLGSRLAYHMYPITYLQGVGMGGSYVADLYTDMGNIGVIIGTMFLVLCINFLNNNLISDKNIFTFSMSLLAARWIIYVPRTQFFAWVTQTISIANLAFILFFYIVYKTLKEKK